MNISPLNALFHTLLLPSSAKSNDNNKTNLSMCSFTCFAYFDFSSALPFPTLKIRIVLPELLLKLLAHFVTCHLERCIVIHCSMYEHLGCFRFSSISNNTAMNITTHIPMCTNKRL